MSNHAVCISDPSEPSCELKGLAFPLCFLLSTLKYQNGHSRHPQSSHSNQVKCSRKTAFSEKLPPSDWGPSIRDQSSSDFLVVRGRKPTNYTCIASVGESMHHQGQVCETSELHLSVGLSKHGDLPRNFFCQFISLKRSSERRKKSLILLPCSSLSVV